MISSEFIFSRCKKERIDEWMDLDLEVNSNQIGAHTCFDSMLFLLFIGFTNIYSYAALIIL
jgi:hypothetical protein